MSNEEENEDEKKGLSSSSFDGATTAIGMETKVMVVVAQTADVQRIWRHVPWCKKEALTSINKWRKHRLVIKATVAVDDRR